MVVLVCGWLKKQFRVFIYNTLVMFNLTQNFVYLFAFQEKKQSFWNTASYSETDFRNKKY